MTPCQKLLKQEGTARRIESMQQSSATPSLHLWFLGVAEDCCMLSILLAVPSCFNSFWHGVIPTSYFIFNDFYTCMYMDLCACATVCMCIAHQLREYVHVIVMKKGTEYITIHVHVHVHVHVHTRLCIHVHVYILCA